MALPMSQTLLNDVQVVGSTHFQELTGCRPVFSLKSNGQTKLSALAVSDARKTFSSSRQPKSVFLGSLEDLMLSESAQVPNYGTRTSLGMLTVRAAATAEKSKKHYPGEAKGFVEEMKLVAMRFHSKDVAKEGEREPDAQPISKWEPTIEGYLKFLVDSKLVYDTLESIVQEAKYPAYAEFRNTGLERSAKLAKDLEWFKQQGHAIPEPSSPGISYASYLEELAVKDPPAFICHFYNFYFAHTAGGRIIGKNVAKKILDGRELEFYKWEGDLAELLKHVREKLNNVAKGWSRLEKNHCLEETEKSFEYSGKILRLIVS